MTGTGCISTPQETLRTMLSQCAAFQGWAGPGYPWDAAEALTHIHHDRLPDPADHAAEYSADERADYLPFAIVWTSPEGGFELEAVGAVGEGAEYWQSSGELWVEFYRAAPAPPDDMTFRDWLGAVISNRTPNAPGLLELAASSGALALHSIRVYGPRISTPEEYPEFGPLQTMLLVIRWS